MPFKPTFKQRAGSSKSIVKIAYVMSTQMLHTPRYCILWSRGHQQVHMICHQHPCVNLNTKLSRAFWQPIDIGRHIFIGTKANLSVISTLNNMYRHTNRKIASSSWHRKGLLVIRYWAILSTPVSSKRRHYSQCCEKKLGCRARQWLEVMSANCKFYSDPIYSIYCFS